jgi:hypothetical protein
LAIPFSDARARWKCGRKGHQPGQARKPKSISRLSIAARYGPLADLLGRQEEIASDIALVKHSTPNCGALPT